MMHFLSDMTKSRQNSRADLGITNVSDLWFERHMDNIVSEARQLIAARSRSTHEKPYQLPRALFLLLLPLNVS
jgi:hypothetical protein